MSDSVLKGVELKNLKPLDPEKYVQAFSDLLAPHVGRPATLVAIREQIPDPRPGDKALRTRKGSLYIVVKVDLP